MQEAKLRLERSARNIQEISDSLGFRDPTYFSHFFKRKTGLSPAGYREMARVSSGSENGVLSSGYADWPSLALLLETGKAVDAPAHRFPADQAGNLEGGVKSELEGFAKVAALVFAQVEIGLDMVDVVEHQLAARSRVAALERRRGSALMLGDGRSSTRRSGRRARSPAMSARPVPP